MKATFNGYVLTPQCKALKNSRYSVAIMIEKELNNKVMTAVFGDEKISLILEVEAEKESINFGKNLIKNGLVSF